MGAFVVFLILEEMLLDFFFPCNMMALLTCSYISFTMLRYIPYYSYFIQVFYREEILTCFPDPI